ncbi:MAG TPA: amidohydrolase family protein [Roseateles sp.]
MKIDSHQHCWRLARGDYDWLDVGDAALAPLARDFEPGDLAPLRAAHGVVATVLVQAAATEAETDHLLALSRADDSIAGVVGWIDLTDASRLPTLQRWAADPKFKGVRPMLQDLPDTNWLDHSPSPVMVQTLIDLGLRFDALVKTEHLPALARFAARWPQLPLVIDHAAKPALAQGWRAPWAKAWRAGLGELARLPNVYCKFSGLLTELGEHAEPAEAVAPIWQTLVSLFGAERLMWGSDWPVLNLAGDYDSWVELAGGFIATLPAAAQPAVWRGTATRFYGLAA